jgi:hypothetical protein
MHSPVSALDVAPALASQRLTLVIVSEEPAGGVMSEMGNITDLRIDKMPGPIEKLELSLQSIITNVRCEPKTSISGMVRLSPSSGATRHLLPQGQKE